MGLFETVAVKAFEAVGAKAGESIRKSRTRVYGNARNAQTAVIAGTLELVQRDLIDSNFFPDSGLEGIGLFKDEHGSDIYSSLKQGAKVGYPVYYTISLENIVQYLEKAIKDQDLDGELKVVHDPYYEDDFFVGQVWIESIVVSQEIIDGNKLAREASIFRSDDKTYYNIESVNQGMTILVNFIDPIPGHTSESIMSSLSKLKDYYNFNFIEVSNSIPGVWLQFELIRDTDPLFKEGNRILREAGIVRNEDLTFMRVKSARKDGNIIVQFKEPFFNHTVEDLVNSFSKLKDTYKFRYVDYTTSIPNVWLQVKLISNAAPELIDANNLIREVGVVPESDMKLYNVKLLKSPEEYTLVFDETIHGVNSSEIVSKTDRLKERYNARIVRPYYRTNGLVNVSFIIKDYLDEGKMIDYMPEFDPKTMTVDFAIDAFGEDVSIMFDSVPGWLVSGVPGSGKTAGVTTFLTPLAASEYVDLTIVDGKGGSDWDAYRDSAVNFVSGIHTPELLDEAHRVITGFEARMNERVSMLKPLFGQPNFWNASVEERVKADMRFDLLVVDECQVFFGNITSTDREEKQKYAEIAKSLEFIVRKGRSAGVAVIFISQKFTMNDLPTGIRDNADGRMSFRLSTHNSCSMTFPSVEFTSGIPDPCSIPRDRKGGVVLDNGNGLIEARALYLPDKAIRSLLSELSPSKKLKLIEKIIKLRTVASNTSFDDERTTALQAVDMLIEKYNITEADIREYKP